MARMAITTDTDRSPSGTGDRARRAGGAATVKPNPLVGAVVARDEEVLGEGWHERYGGPHAEVNAIAACGAADLTGATLYVSLEPCCHEGKTPPCTDAIMQAGIGRVVVGLRRSHREGIRSGPWDPARRGRRGRASPTASWRRARGCSTSRFASTRASGRPWVLFKSAMTLDGKVATRAGDSQWISGEESR